MQNKIFIALFSKLKIETIRIKNITKQKGYVALFWL